MARGDGMAPLFCLRLAFGLVGALLLLSPAQVNPRFYRVQFLVVLGLLAVAAIFLRDRTEMMLWLAMGGGMLLAFLGSVVWSLEGAPLGQILIGSTGVVVGLALGLAEWAQAGEGEGEFARLFIGDLSSAALLGMAVTAMLMGHSYLIAPAMSLTPLLRLLAGLAVATLVRMAISALSLWSWTGEHSLTTLTEVTLLLPVRWLVGFVGPLVLAWMAWQAARIRSTQSATGILYVAVILCFLGELTGQLLQSNSSGLLS
jgi:hypothetical protein